MRHALACVPGALVAIGIATSAAAQAPSFPSLDHKSCQIGVGDEAIAACSRLISSDPSNTDYVYWRAIAYLEGKHDYDRAIADFDQAIRLDPKSYYYAYRGNAYRSKGDYDHAIAEYDHAIRLAPQYATAYTDRGYAYQRKGDYDRAIADYGEAIRLDPKDAAGYTNRGNAYAGKGDYDQAIAEYDQAIRLNPQYVIAYNSRGNAYLYGKHDYDRAIADYDQTLKLDPNVAGAYVDRGSAYHEKGDYRRAIADYDQAILLDPKSADAYNGRCWAYDAKKEFDPAMADCNQAILLDPNYPNAYDSRGYAWAGKGDYDLAIADYDQAIRLDPKFARTYSNRGDVYAKKHDYPRAIADYDQALKLDPNDAFAREGRERAQALLTANRPGPAPAQAQLPPQTSPPQAASPAVLAERRVALVIGNSGYTSGLVPALPNPRRDAKLVADALRKAGFETAELTDLDHPGMVKALQAFRAKADSADWALVYFAGHGMEINRVNYLLPVDAKLADSRDVELEAVSYEAMLNAINGAKALRIIILDACRNNPFKAQMHQTVALRGSLERGLAAPSEAEPGTLVVYSAKEGEAAVDGDDINSPFAQAFVKRLKTPGREVRRMFDDVSDDVIEATSRHQQPFTYGRLPGKRDFFFVTGK